ncbi:vitamin K epoxide reductase family protein [Nocardioides sp.]|uniref:vitamin K epoxide reductase family protein n=1 Tax=Nocardioides sp. TaxID=35761 RepID=UPI00263A14A4|nr:vitamin K epoxide reductase family protein [Nocardioides sp.]
MTAHPTDDALLAEEPDVAPGTDYAAFFDRTLRWLLTVTGVVGLVAAFTLTVEKIALVADPSYVPTCSISPVLSCGSIMSTEQAELFGFPNPLMGLVAFSVLITSGVVLATGARLPRWYWLGLQGGATLGLVFVAWLVEESLYDIGALCPYCMVVWAVVIRLFVLQVGMRVSSPPPMSSMRSR